MADELTEEKLITDYYKFEAITPVYTGSMEADFIKNTYGNYIYRDDEYYRVISTPTFTNAGGGTNWSIYYVYANVENFKTKEVTENCQINMVNVYSNPSSYHFIFDSTTYRLVTSIDLITIDNLKAYDAARTAITDTKLATKQDTLTFDTVPTEDSTNPVTSGGIKTALDNLDTTITQNVADTYVPKTTEINGHALTGNVDVLYSDIIPPVGTVIVLRDGYNANDIYPNTTWINLGE